MGNEEKKDIPLPEPRPSQPESTRTPIEAGIYYEERRKTERNFLLERLQRARVSSKGLDSLRTMMETTSSLEDLQRKLDTAEHSFDPESFAEIQKIIREIRSLSESDLNNLKEEILSIGMRTNPSIFVSINETVYPTHGLDLAKKLEQSILGENILKDIAGMSLGALDSGYALLKLIVDLLADIIRLPTDIIRLTKNQNK